MYWLWYNLPSALMYWLWYNLPNFSPVFFWTDHGYHGLMMLRRRTHLRRCSRDSGGYKGHHGHKNLHFYLVSKLKKGLQCPQYVENFIELCYYGVPLESVKLAR